MVKHRSSPSKVEHPEKQFEELLAAMGFGEAANPFSRAALIQGLRDIERNYKRQVALSDKQPKRRQVHQYRAAITKLLTLSETIGPDFLANEIEKARFSRQNPDVDEMTLQLLLEEHGRKRDDVIDVLTERALNLDHWLKTSGDSYKKRDVRKLVVELFLRLLAEYKITTSRKQLPRKRIFDALFDWIGIERKFRPTSANINEIARELQANASSS